jgi:hypothetical protein
MTKKELQEMITIAVRTVVRKEIKPLIEATIKKEFNKILDEADSGKPPKTKTLMTDNTMPQGKSLMTLIEEDKEDDSTRAEINERIFKGKTPFKEKNPFSEVLNQTATEVETRTGIYSNPMKQTPTSTQKKVVLDQPMVESVAPDTPVTEEKPPPPSRESLAAAIGYGDMKPKSSGLKKILAEDQTSASDSPANEIELPTMSAGGDGGQPKPIDYSKVPTSLVKNMMKDYSGLLKEVESKVKRPE